MSSTVATIQQCMDAMKAKLVADSGTTGVYTLSKGRIYEMVIPHNIQNPTVVISQFTDAEDSTLCEDLVDFQVKVEIRVNSDSGVSTARTIAERIRTVLNRSSSTIGTETLHYTSNNRGLPILVEDYYLIVQYYRLQCT